MAESLGERGAGALFNELFAVAEKSERLSSRFALLGNLFEIPNWVLLDSALYYLSYCIDHIPLSTLCVSARSIATVTTFCPFSSLTIVVTDIDGDGDAAEDGGAICSLLPDCARSSMVEKLLNSAERRLESLGGRRHADAGQPDSKSATSFHAHLRTLAPFEPRMEKEHGAQPFPRLRHVTFHLSLRFFNVALRHGISNCPVNLHTPFDTSY